MVVAPRFLTAGKSPKLGSRRGSYDVASFPCCILPFVLWFALLGDGKVSDLKGRIVDLDTLGLSDSILLLISCSSSMLHASSIESKVLDWVLRIRKGSTRMHWDAACLWSPFVCNDESVPETLLAMMQNTRM